MVDLSLQFPDGFFDEEVRWDFTVTGQMKEIWAVELDMLAQLDRVCRKYGLTYFATGGTLLGAVRHKGFIPWDDDIDVGMMRDDYEKLCEVAPKELSHPYFFQTEYTDPGCMFGFAKIRNSDTTGMLRFEFESKYGYNQGIAIDVFPFDNLIGDEAARKRQVDRVMELKDRAKYWITWTKYRNEKVNTSSLKVKVKNLVIKMLSSLFLKRSHSLYTEFEKECRRFDEERTERKSMISFMPDNRKLDILEADYHEFTRVPFEFMTIPVPVRYDHALTIQYGDYMKPVKGGAYHTTAVYDTAKSYKEYLL